MKNYKQYNQNDTFESDFVFPETLITKFNKLIPSFKALYYENLSKNLNNLLFQTKIYWSILKKFHCDKKVQIIQPLFIDKNFVTGIQIINYKYIQ